MEAGTGQRLPASRVAEKMLIWLNVLAGQLYQEGPERLWELYADLLADQDRSVNVRDAAGTQVSGRVIGVGSEGQLLLRDNNGISQGIVAGIVEWNEYERTDD